jgi:hypothetical protein
MGQRTREPGVRVKGVRAPVMPTGTVGRRRRTREPDNGNNPEFSETWAPLSLSGADEAGYKSGFLLISPPTVFFAPSTLSLKSNSWETE